MMCLLVVKFSVCFGVGGIGHRLALTAMLEELVCGIVSLKDFKINLSDVRIVRNRQQAQGHGRTR